jgi:ABC-type glycerol-3-phosphate transport system substrate-binding protein
MALKNFIKSYEFSSSVKLTTWDDVVKEFKSGDSAMAILYDSYAGDLNHYTKSKVAGNLGVAQIPGGTPVLGGWGIGINKRSPNNNEVAKFLEWLTSNKTVLPLILLGGSTLRKSYYTNDYLENIFPWKKEMLESYKKSRKRILPTKQVMDKGRNYIYSHIISKQIIRAINNEISVEKALENMEREINKSQH